jgi:hypothetical protein
MIALPAGYALHLRRDRVSSLFDVPAQLALALSLAASAGGGGGKPVLDPPAQAALDMFELTTIEGPYRFSDAIWFRALKEAASGEDAGDVAGSIFRTSGGRYYVPASAERSRILQKRYDANLAERIARSFAEHNADVMEEGLQRAPTPGELYIAHLFGPELATSFIRRVEAAPGKSAAKEMPEFARIAPGLVFERGVSLSMGEVYDRLTQPVKAQPGLPVMKPTVVEPANEGLSASAAAAMRASRDGWRPNLATASAQPPIQ